MSSIISGEDGVLLLKKGKTGLLNMIFGRTMVVVVLLLLQAGILFSVFEFLGSYIPYIFGTSLVFMLVMMIHILNTNANPTVKITWLVLVMLVPVFGSLLYVFIKTEVGHSAVRDRLKVILEGSKNELETKKEIKQTLKEENKELYNLSTYINKTGCFPIFDNTSVKYFALGEEKFEQLLIELENAKSFIFLEYFIVNEGYMWGRILEILARKAKAGLEIRVMYDGTLELFSLPHSYPKKLAALGIKCKAFAPIRPFVSTHYNYRDHRKIFVIDGHTAFTGGVNISDEYINKREVYGHWKDTAVMLKGDGVKSFTLMFLQMWNIDEKHTDYDKWLSFPTLAPADAAGYVIPYGDCPLDDFKLGEMVYIDMFNNAKDYVHFMTPYLILDGEMETAIKFAAERGVDVKLILPHIPDKKFAFALAKTHYKILLEAGVKIYEYTPGFVHAKTFVSDDISAICGTINLDYRSLYHHFECAAYMYNCPAIAQIEKDMQNTLAKSQEVTLSDLKHEKLSMRIMGRVLKVLAPLM